MPLIQMTAITSRDLDQAPKRFLQQTRTRAKKGLHKWAGLFKNEYDKTIATWKVRPIFTIKYESTAEGESAIISTDNNIYRFLHDGTKIRWAIMSADFSAKTTPHVLGSNMGSGRAILKGRKAMGKAGIQTAMPGIKAREWTQEILRLYETKFQTDMDKIVFGDFPSS